MKLTVMHYPLGKSRFNRIERALWAPISRSLRGKALDTIEDVSRHVCRTTTKGGNGQPPLHVECYFDSKKYKRRNETLETQNLTRKKLEEKAQGRIIHPFDKEKDGTLYKWNYVILPEAPETEAV